MSQGLCENVFSLIYNVSGSKEPHSFNFTMNSDIVATTGIASPHSFSSSLLFQMLFKVPMYPASHTNWLMTQPI